MGRHGLSRPRPVRMFLSILGGFGAAVVLVAVVGRLIRHAGGAAGDYSMFGPLKGNLPEYLFWAIPVSLGSAAFGEEMIFRGFLRDALQRLFGAQGWLAVSAVIVGQAALFGVVHLIRAGAALRRRGR